MPETVKKEILPFFYEENSIIAFPNNNHFYAPNSYCFSPHCHDWMEILYVFYGSIQVQVNQEVFIVNTGECALFFPGQLHFALTGDKGARYRIIMFDPSAFYNHTHGSKKLLRPMFEGKNSYINLTSHTDIIQAVHNILACYSDTGTLNSHPLFIIGELYKLLAAIQSNCLINGHKNNPINRSILTVMEYINSHINETLSNETLSDMLGYETSYFIRLFKKNIGMTPRIYIRSIRLEKAQKELASTDTPINVIAHNCGFENMSYFTRAFQEAFHTTPSAYRKESKGNTVPHESRVYL